MSHNHHPADPRVLPKIRGEGEGTSPHLKPPRSCWWGYPWELSKPGCGPRPAWPLWAAGQGRALSTCPAWPSSARALPPPASLLPHFLAHARQPLTPDAPPRPLPRPHPASLRPGVRPAARRACGSRDGPESSHPRAPRAAQTRNKGSEIGTGAWACFPSARTCLSSLMPATHGGSASLLEPCRQALAGTPPCWMPGPMSCKEPRAPPSPKPLIS